MGMSLTATKMRSIRGHLAARRVTLLARYRGELERADEETARPASEPVDAAAEQWDARVLGRMSDIDAHALEVVTAAIRRLDDGTYGVCTGCGERIHADRLDAVPDAAACRDCAAAAEPRRGARASA
jgi:RNA polymerase-binding transcription factor DksA